MEFKEDTEMIPWPTDMNGKKLNFGDVVFDTYSKQKFRIEHFERPSGLLRSYWYVSDEEGFPKRWSLACKKIKGDESW